MAGLTLNHSVFAAGILLFGARRERPGVGSSVKSEELRFVTWRDGCAMVRTRTGRH